MGRASTEMEAMRKRMVEMVEHLSPEDVKAMLLRTLSSATTYEMQVMAEATSFESFENMDWNLE